MTFASPSSSAARRATNVSLDPHLIEEARQLGINISRACERGLAEQIAEARAAIWLTENAAALASSNNFADEHGLPLAASRLF
ncbi:MAG TPA: type II toxin-antitoxin system CcdA family antitoxin [Sphingomonas sp.]|nr:type II toxin-antitoxin system CcdA family antitoxin [Sphingomonas sp.]